MPFLNQLAPGQRLTPSRVGAGAAGQGQSNQGEDLGGEEYSHSLSHRGRPSSSSSPLAKLSLGSQGEESAAGEASQFHYLGDDDEDADDDQHREDDQDDDDAHDKDSSEEEAARGAVEPTAAATGFCTLPILAARCNSYLYNLENASSTPENLAELRSLIVAHAAEHPECHGQCAALIIALRGLR